MGKVILFGMMEEIILGILIKDKLKGKENLIGQMEINILGIIN